MGPGVSFMLFQIGPVLFSSFSDVVFPFVYCILVDCVCKIFQ